MKIPKIEYEIYYPLNNTLTKLNISSCEGTKIEISIKVEINDTLDKYNPKSAYYNDICSKATSDSGTDINLKDRKNEFIDKNMSLCEENCIFVEYNYTNKKAKCSCDIKLKIPEVYDIKFNKNDFLKSFIEVKNIINLNVMKCYKEVWKLHNLKKNYGCFIISFIILFYFFSILIFCCCSFGKLTKEIKNIIFSLKYYESSKIKKDKIYKQKKYFKNNNKENKIKKFNKAKKKQKKKVIQKLITQSNSNKSYQIFKIKEINDIKLTKVNNKSNKKALELKDFEINSLNYEEALFMDKRGYFEYYCSLLKNNHPLFFSFIT